MTLTNDMCYSVVHVVVCYLVGYARLLMKIVGKRLQTHLPLELQGVPALT